MRKIVVLLIAIAVVLAGCNAEKKLARKNLKQINSAKAIFAQFPNAFSEACAVQFPVKVDSTFTKEHIIGKSDTMVNKTAVNITADVIKLIKNATDSTRNKIIDSLLAHPIIVMGDCPPSVSRVDTFREKTSVSKEVTAELSNLRYRLDTTNEAKTKAGTRLLIKEQELKKETAKANKFVWCFWILVGLIVLYIVLRFFKKVR